MLEVNTADVFSEKEGRGRNKYQRAFDKSQNLNVL